MTLRMHLIRGPAAGCVQVFILSLMHGPPTARRAVEEREESPHPRVGLQLWTEDDPYAGTARLLHTALHSHKYKLQDIASSDIALYA